MGAVGKRQVRLFSAGAQGVSTLFFLHLSYFQPRYHVKTLTVTYIYIDPLTSLVISTMIIGEKMTGLQIIGTILLLGSTFMSEMDKTSTISLK
ncbi:hypothetical protein P9597_04475 [Aneurinibacillus migulanus]|uniref:hypothetical protein n=1 Tax=Aneurinibacillus migulanus TaxID=47500 RepID=UPI002E1CB6CF|nr:hypothetical protein [Aneurinibacillus migulanus]